MFDSLPENTRSDDVVEARAKALRRLWRFLRLLAPPALFVFGALALVVGGVLLSSVFLTRQRGPAVRTVSGTVVGLQRRQMIEISASGNSDVYAPIVRFQVDGQPHEFTSRMFTDRPDWTVGQAVEVLYDPTSGRTAIAGLADWRPALEFTVLGVGLLALGSVLRRRNRTGS